MRKAIFLLILVLSLTFAAGTALANNDPVSPGDNCSGNPVAIGQPGELDVGILDAPGIVNATDIVDVLRGENNPVDGPASDNNPGESSGAKGQVKSGLRCL